MPKNVKTSPARKAKLTPEEAKHQEALAEIKSVTDVQLALARWTELRNQVDALSSKKEELRVQARDADKLRSKAADAQDYVAAQAHKEKHEALESERNGIGAQLTPLVDFTDAARTRYTELFLADETAPYNQPEEFQFTRKQVINPVTMNFTSVVYTDSSDTVSLSLDGQYFESEAYHIEGWAAERGFVMRKDEATLTF